MLQRSEDEWSAVCVQRFDDSLSFAIRITYRISLRSSSLREPRYPLLKVVLVSIIDMYHLSQVCNTKIDKLRRVSTLTGAQPAIRKPTSAYCLMAKPCGTTTHIAKALPYYAKAVVSGRHM